MRKIFKMLTAVALAVVASMALAACSSDNDDEPKGENQLKSIYWSISGAVSGDADDIFEYEASILLPNGEKQKLTGITLSSPAKLTGIVEADEVKLPAEFTMSIVRKVKDDYVAADGQTATWSESFALNIVLADEDNYCFNEKEAGYNDQKIGVRLAEWLPKFGNSTQTLTIKVRKSGDSYMLE